MSKPQIYRPRDFLDGAPPRIIGTETEYFSSYDDLNWVERYLERSSIRSGEFDGSGARVYRDVTTLTEITTPECRTPELVAAYETAAALRLARIVADCGKFAGQVRMFRQGGGYGMTNYPQQLLRYNSLGYHQNFLIPSRVRETVKQKLPSFLATATVVSGAGIVRPDGTLFLSQKAFGVGSSTDGQLTKNGKKAMVMMRTDDDTVAENFGRVEVRCADPNLDPRATARNLAMTSVILRLIEHRSFPDEALLAMPARALRIVSADPTLQAKLSTQHGARIGALAHQERLLEAAQGLMQKVQLPSSEQLAVAQWRAALECLAEPVDVAPEGVATIGWLQMRALWEGIKVRHGYNDTTQKSAFSQQMTNICTNAVGGRLLGRFASESGIADTLVDQPPADTRAAIRVQAAKEGDKVVSWSKIRHTSDMKDRMVTIIQNPYVCEL